MAVDGPIRGTGAVPTPQVSGSPERLQNSREAFASPSRRVVNSSLNRSAAAPAPKKPPTQNELETLGRQLDAIDAKIEKKTSALAGFAWNLRFAWASLTNDKITLANMIGELRGMHDEKLEKMQAFKATHAVAGDLVEEVREAQKMGRVIRLQDKVGAMKKACDQIVLDAKNKRMSPATRAHYAKTEVREHFKLLRDWVNDAAKFLSDYQADPKQFTPEQIEREFSSVDRLMQAFNQEKERMNAYSRLDLQWQREQPAVRLQRAALSDLE